MTSTVITAKEQMNIVIIGHVDHGKSTVIGRLLADTDSLPQGKLEQVKEMCRRNAKPFEYAFLLDALKDEQSQGITIDSARCFFKTTKRDYIIIDAPGHIEFLKNMVSGAARAEAALLVIDAHEGIQENSRRHGYLLSMLGIKQVAILVNKMDLVEYDEKIFEDVKAEYSQFLSNIQVNPETFIPISAMNGDNITHLSSQMTWYEGYTLLEQIDRFNKEEAKVDKPLRFPVQDIYKFTENNDNRRIVSGKIETGSVNVGEEVIFLPSMKTSTVKTIEYFNAHSPKQSVEAGEVPGFTLSTQIYITPGEIMCKKGDPLPKISHRFKANLFWMGRSPMVMIKPYKLKLASTRVMVKLVDILNVIDASDLTSNQQKKQIDRHDVAECVFETSKPIAFDLVSEFESTSRFVIVDNYEIAGGGIVTDYVSDTQSTLKEHIKKRDYAWEVGKITLKDRELKHHHKSKFILITGESAIGKKKIAEELEQNLFSRNYHVYYLGISSILGGLDKDLTNRLEDREEHIRRLGELARIFTDAGQIFITTISDIDDYDLETLKLLNEPNEVLVINVGSSNFEKYNVHLNIDQTSSPETAVKQIIQLLQQKNIMPEYFI